MLPDDPRHGTHAGWSQHDREGEKPCDPCSEARRAYQRVRPHLHALGKSPKVALGQLAYDNLRTLVDAGLTRSQLERATGTAASSLDRYMETGPTIVVRRKVRTRLEQVNPAAAIVNRLTHEGTIRRTQALARIGYSASKIAPHAGLGADSVALLQSGRARFSSDSTRRKIDQAYRLLHMKPLDPTHDKYVSRTINRAIQNGWAAPMAYDDIDHDAAPRGGSNHRSREDVDEATVLRVLAGDNLPTSPAEKREIVRRWRAAGHPLNELERRTGWQVNRYGKGRAA